MRPSPIYVKRAVYEWSFGVQRQLTGDTLLEATYFGSSGNHFQWPGISTSRRPARVHRAGTGAASPGRRGDDQSRRSSTRTRIMNRCS